MNHIFVVLSISTYLYSILFYEKYSCLTSTSILCNNMKRDRFTISYKSCFIYIFFCKRGKFYFLLFNDYDPNILNIIPSFIQLHNRILYMRLCTVSTLNIEIILLISPLILFLPFSVRRVVHVQIVFCNRNRGKKETIKYSATYR